MAIYTNYATLSDLAEYLGIPEASLPDNSQRLLNRASELIKQITLNNINIANTNHMEAAKLATCSQVEYWNELGETSALSGDLKSFTIGNFSATLGGNGSSENSSNSSQVSLRAKNYLNQQGLLYKGVSLIADCECDESN